jgi:hypothetical protein
LRRLLNICCLMVAVAGCDLAALAQTEFKFLPRAEDFAVVFKSLEVLTFPGWEITAAKVIDFGDGAQLPVSEKMALLKEYHCNELLSKTYSDAQNKLTLELCRFDSSAGAFGAYTCFREGASTVIRRGDGSSEDDTGISFWQNHYLVLLRSTGENSEACKDIMWKIADQLEQGIEGHATTPAVLTELPYMDRAPGTEHVFMGPLAAHKFSPLHITNDTMLNNCVIGSTADYQIGPPFSERLKVMLIDYKDPNSANAACRQLVNDVCPNCGVPQPESPTIFKLAGRFAWCQVHGAKLGVVCNGRRATSVAMIGHQLNW